jgi:hypothetical protein
MRLLLVAKVRPTIRASLSARDLDGGSTPEKSDEISAEFSVAMEIKRNEGVAGWGWPTREVELRDWGSGTRECHKLWILSV